MAAQTHLSQQHSCSFDHLVGAGEQRCRDREAERLSGLEIDHQFEFGWLQDGQVPGILTLQNPPSVSADLAIPVSKAGAVAHQTASYDVVATTVNRWHRMTGRQRN